MSIVRYPYEGDPNAVIELVAQTHVEDERYEADQMPVLSARVSHAGSDKTGNDAEADIKLMNYLASHKHMTPFEHQYVTFRVKAPIFVFREWHRHRTQAYNEVSMRYCSDPVGTLYRPYTWRQQATRNKQSSAGTLIPALHMQAEAILQEAYTVAIRSYNDLLDLGVCREQARTVIPVGNYSDMYASANLRNWAGFCALRQDPNAQWEIRMFANAIDEMLHEIYPNSWGALKVGQG